MRLFFLFLFLVISISITAQINDLYCTPIAKEDGSTFGLVRMMQKDAFGFLWLGTENGVVKISDTKSSIYNSVGNSKKTICGNDVTDLVFINNKKTLVVIQALAGISQIDVNTDQVIFTNTLAALENRVIVSAVFSNNFLYVITIDGVLHTYNPRTNRIENSFKFPIKFEKIIRKIIEIENYFVLCDEGGSLYLIDKNNNKLLDIKKLSAKSLYHWKYQNFISSNNLLVTATGIHKISVVNDKLGIENVFSSISVTGEVVDFLEHKNLKILATERGLFNFSDGFKEIKLVSNSKNIQWKIGITQLLQESNGIWVASGNGLALIKNLLQPINQLSIPSNFKIADAAFTSLKRNRNKIYLGTSKDIVTYSAEKNVFLNDIKVFEKHEFVPIDNSKVLAITESNRINEMSNYGLIRSNLLNLDRNILNKHLLMFNDSLLVALNTKSNSIQLCNNKTKVTTTLFNLNNLSDIGLIRRIKKNTDSVFYCILADKVYSYNIFNNQKTIVQAIDANTNKAAIIIMDMIEVGNFKYLCIYGMGLYKLNYKNEIVEKFGVSHGFKNLNVINVIKKDNDNLVITSDKGFYLFNVKTKELEWYNQNNGLGDNIIFENAIEQYENKLYLGTQNGISIINLDELKPESNKPNLFFDGINIKTTDLSYDTCNKTMKEITFPDNYIQSTISFATNNYSEAGKFIYKYRVTELGNVWTDIGTKQEISIIGLQHGTYTVEVIAIKNGVIESDALKLKITILSKWYQTILFKIAVILVIATILYALYKYRINQLTKLLAMRQKISQDLHDDVGSSLSSIKIYSQVVQLQNSDNHIAKNIETNTTEVLEKLDDIVWSTNPKNDNLQNVIDRLELFAQPLCKTAKINLVWHMPTNNVDMFINEFSRHSLYMIVKEAINNAVKYAQCQTIIFGLQIHSKTITATIADDGIGFDTTIATNRNGLLNMQLRAIKAKGKFSITSTPNKGTTIAVTLPKK